MGMLLQYINLELQEVAIPCLFHLPLIIYLVRGPVFSLQLFGKNNNNNNNNNN